MTSKPSKSLRSVNILVTIGAGLLLGALPSRAQVILNPSFEIPALAANSAAHGTAGADWTVTGTTAAASVFSNDYAGLGNTPFGRQYLALFGPENNDPVTEVSQVVLGFVAGETYTITVEYASLSGSSNLLTLSLAGQIFLGSTLSNSYAAPAADSYGSGDIPFQKATLTFIPFVSGSATFGIEDTTVNGALDVDNVVLTNAAPEPAVSADVLLGFCALAALPLYRRRAVSRL